MRTWSSRRISQLVQSDIRAMTRECIRVGGLNLGQGLCELPTPEPVVQAAQMALASNEKSVYSPPEGVIELRRAIQKKLRDENHIQVSAETEIVVTNGATGGYAATLMALLNPGDGLLLFEPYYGYHLNTALLAELDAQIIPMKDKNLAVDAAAIEATIRPNTRAIVICTPNNPSGKMWTEGELKTIAQIATKHDLLVITDEMYEYFRFDGREHLSPMAIPELADRTVTLMGLSKTFSITGWRLGYVAAREPLAQKIKLANDLFYVCAPTPLQFGVEAGFRLDQSYFQSLQDEFKIKRDQICATLETVGMPPIVPQGAYYVLADISRFQMDNSRTFALTMLEKIKVAAVPGRSFFQSAAADRYVRFCFAVEDDVLNEACRRIGTLKGGL